MTDIFVERMVKKRFDTKDFIIMILTFLLGFIIVIASIMVVFPVVFVLGLLIVGGACFGMYKVVTMLYVEYEYSVTNGYVTVDKIINRAKRKRLDAFECNTVEQMGKYTEAAESLKHADVSSRIYAGEYRDGRNSWYIVSKTKNSGRALILFDPDEKMLDSMKRFLPATVRMQAFR